MNWTWPYIVLFAVVPISVIAIVIIMLHAVSKKSKGNEKYRVRFKLKNGGFKIENVRRGVSIIGSAGSGKTESVVNNFLHHFAKYDFCGVIHDYKDFELTEIAYPLFKNVGAKFYTIAFDQVHYRVNPIAPKYLPNEESVNEVSRVLMENLLEQNLSENTGSNKFFSDAVEGLLAGLIWKMKTDYPDFCTLPHIIALYQTMNTKKLVAFLKSNFTSWNMASAFLNGIESEKQTAGVKSTLSNAFKKISSQKLFYVLSKDEVPLDINNPKNPAIISLVNHPKYDSVYSPIIALVLHTIIKQMSIRNRNCSFLLMEEAPTIKLPNMHRVPATLRSYDISTVYVMQDKIQNDLLYGDKASKAILSNLSYQFFGKVNDPETAKYYERFFEIVKTSTTSISKSSGLSLESRITKGEREVSKRRADVFFRLKQGEFIAFADGRDRLLKFKKPNLSKEKPIKSQLQERETYRHKVEQIYRDVARI